MGVIGKVVGGTIGFALLGPLGAIAGAAFGHAFDKSDDRYLEGGSLGSPGVSAGEQAQFMFFVAAFSMLAKLARADGRVSREEIDSIEKFMLYDLNLDPQGRQVAMNIFHTAVQSPETFENFALQFYGQFSGQPQMLDLMVDIMLRVSLADGSMSPGEEKLILSAVSIFNFSEAHYRQIRSRYFKEVDKYTPSWAVPRMIRMIKSKSSTVNLWLNTTRIKSLPRDCQRNSPSLPRKNSGRSRRPTKALRRRGG